MIGEIFHQNINMGFYKKALKLNFIKFQFNQ